MQTREKKNQPDTRETDIPAPARRKQIRQVLPDIAGLLATLLLAASVHAGDAYPLDGLSDEELEVAVQVLNEAGKLDDTSRISIITLAEPDKAAVLRWQSGDTYPRRAFAIVRHDAKVYESIIDLDNHKLEFWAHKEGVQPAMIPEEWLQANKIVRSSPAWKKAIEARGIENLKTVICVPYMPAYFGSGDASGPRLGRITCFDNSSPAGSWGRPIGGLVATVDFDRQEIIELINEDPAPIPAGGPVVPADQPAEIPAVSAAGLGFHVSGNWVEWDRWRFHLRVDPRVGPVLSNASFRDGGARRSVLYQAYMSEIFVPYMNPEKAWYFRTFLDIGEYGIGSAGVPMKVGLDCPADAKMIDAAFVSERGKVSTQEGIACIFERTTGDVAWTHYERAQQGSLSRRYTELVVRFIAWLGNYDYVVDWIFTPTGSIKGRIGATGIVQVQAVDSSDMASDTITEDTAFGRLVAPNAVAVNHDHFFNFRIDLDVDGTDNGFVVDKLRRVKIDDDHFGTPRTSIWQLETEAMASESVAKRTIDLQNPVIWRVMNSAVKNSQDQAVSYQLRPGSNAVSLLDPDSYPQRRAAFTNHHLWVTPYAPGERYAAGDYPNQHAGGAGLPDWTRNDRSIQDTDIVLWYTVGMHHVVRTEDWPIMPVLHHEFEIRPFDFFDYNPAIADDETPAPR